MSIQSDLYINASKLKPEAASAETKQLNNTLIGVTQKGPRWYEVGAPKYRQMMENGETALGKPIHLPQAQSMRIPSRDVGREIGCCVFMPEGGQEVNGVFLHIHGGGWCLGSERK